MQNLIIRSGVLFFGAVLQISFLAGFVSSKNMPFIMIAYAVAITIIRGFDRALPWVIAAAIVSDLLSFRLPGESAIPLVLISYIVSFISRKVWLANKLWSWVAISTLVGCGAIFSYIYYLFLQTFLDQMSFSGWLKLFSLAYPHILLSSVYTIIILFIIYWPLEKLEKYLSFFERKTVLKR